MSNTEAQMTQHLKVIIDWDGTLTAEEEQVEALAARSLDTLAAEILGAPREHLAAGYEATRARLLQTPHRYGWWVHGLLATCSDEGAFILNTTTLLVMLGENPAYVQAVARAFPHPQYDPLMDCVNALFHRHTAELSPLFRPATRQVLLALVEHPLRTPVILTNSLGDKVRRHLGALGLGERQGRIAVLGDTRQYDMNPAWSQRFPHPEGGGIQVWPVDEQHRIDLRRPAYYQALRRAAEDGSQLAVVADTFSMPGALPLMMGIPFFLLHTSYTPAWCAQAVASHPLGRVLDDLADLPTALYTLPFSG